MTLGLLLLGLTLTLGPLLLGLLLLGGLLIAVGLALTLLLLLRLGLTFVLFVPTVVARPGSRSVPGFGRAIQRLQLSGRGSACVRHIATASGSRCTRVHRSVLFTDHAHVLRGVAIAALRGFDSARLQRPPGIFLQLLFARGKRTLAGRWCIAREDPTVKRFTQWTHAGGRTGTDHAAHARCNRGNAHNLAGSDRITFEANRRRLHRLRIHEHSAGDHCDGACNRAVGIVHLVDIDSVAGIVVIDVGDGRVVDHRIVHVDPGEIVTAGLIGRHVDFARSKREPADRRTTAERERHAPAAATDECDQCRCVDRANVAWSRNPAPAIGYIDPTSVVRWCEPPGRIVHPGPAPRFLPNPMTVPVGCPIGVDPAGEPHGAVAAHRAPATILIQIRVAHHIVVDVAQRHRAV